MADLPPELSNRSGAPIDSEPAQTATTGRLVHWMGPLFLAVAPFAFFAALMALDGLLP